MEEYKVIGIKKMSCIVFMISIKLKELLEQINRTKNHYLDKLCNKELETIIIEIQDMFIHKSPIIMELVTNGKKNL